MTGKRSGDRQSRICRQYGGDRGSDNCVRRKCQALAPILAVSARSISAFLRPRLNYARSKVNGHLVGKECPAATLYDVLKLRLRYRPGVPSPWPRPHRRSDTRVQAGRPPPGGIRACLASTRRRALRHSWAQRAQPQSRSSRASISSMAGRSLMSPSRWSTKRSASAAWPRTS
jgi:hypothetical protein